MSMAVAVQILIINLQITQKNQEEASTEAVRGVFVSLTDVTWSHTKYHI